MWKPIDTAPIDQDVIVTDGGEPYELHSPFKLTAARHALAVETIRCRPKETVTARRFPPPWTVRQIFPRTYA
jgi:hypothetical protein